LRFILFDEPDENGDNIRVKLTEEEAIKRQHQRGLFHNYAYKNDEDALSDFIINNWAWIEGE